ncbi:hypothetical protein CFP56_034505 [Quercus suber]|uniref:TRF2/HOY1 PH-like domain-containing protein n=1 Tax=Quercus suber TaxID=58331 RepID=A0AAW0LQR2_QUESU
MVHGHDGHILTLIGRRAGSESPLVLSVNSRKVTSYWIQISEMVKKRLKEAKATVENIKALSQSNSYEFTMVGFETFGVKLGLHIQNMLHKQVQQKKQSLKQVQQQKQFISDSEKLKASNFCASLLRICSWMVQPPREAKTSVGILENALKKKKKIEIQWSDIIGIRARIMEDKPGILEIALNNRPAFFDGSNPMPLKYTMWKISSDFTDNQAQTYRFVLFSTFEIL